MLAGAIFSSLAVIALIIIPYVGVAQLGLDYLFGVVVPYAALITFLAGIVYRVLDWAGSPVPFRIPTTCGQEKSMAWVKTNPVDNPSTPGMVWVRMLFEVLTFRSLFRNMNLDYRTTADGTPKISYGNSFLLWLFALLFHYSFLVVLLWHLRFFMEPVPQLVYLIESFDGFLEVGLPQLMISGVMLFAAIGYLLTRRIWFTQLRHISLASDYFPLLLIATIAITGILMRYFFKVDIVSVKEIAMGLVSFKPVVPAGVGSLFYVHFFLVCILIAYFPFSKLMHMGGVFLSPTRNLANNSRARRHINPWNYAVKTHDYHEYEDEFREQMLEAGLPVEKGRPEPEPEEEAAEEGAEAPAEGEAEAEAPAAEAAPEDEKKE